MPDQAPSSPARPAKPPIRWWGTASSAVQAEGCTDDGARVDYLNQSLRHIGRARVDGIDVVGVFFWTGIDNYEWLAGDSVPFGLFDRERRPRRSAELVRGMAPK